MTITYMGHSEHYYDRYSLMKTLWHPDAFFIKKS